MSCEHNKDVIVVSSGLFLGTFGTCEMPNCALPYTNAQFGRVISARNKKHCLLFKSYGRRPHIIFIGTHALIFLGAHYATHVSYGNTWNKLGEVEAIPRAMGIPREL